VLSDSSAYEVAVLPPEIQHQNGVVFGLHHVTAQNTEVSALLFKIAISLLSKVKMSMGVSWFQIRIFLLQQLPYRVWMATGMQASSCFSCEDHSCLTSFGKRLMVVSKNF
jgi:hypothetical protein